MRRPNIFLLALGLMMAVVGSGPPYSAEHRLVCTNGNLAALAYQKCAVLRKNLVALQEISNKRSYSNIGYTQEILEKLLSISNVHVYTTGSVKVMTFNVGNASYKFTISNMFPFIIKPSCPHFKLCDSNMIKRIKNHISIVKPDILFIQEVQGVEQLVEHVKDGPILSSNYDAICTYGHAGILENCVAWYKDRVSLSGTCRAVLELEGGAILCPLVVDGLMIQAISAHPSAWDKKERQAVMRSMWHKLIDRTKPAIVGGDFNTEMQTFGFTEQYPYPAEFGTLFGRYVKHYGRWESQHTFFGSYHRSGDGKYTRPKAHRTTSFGKTWDMLFANFGHPMPFHGTGNTCSSYACVGGRDTGYAWRMPGLSVWPHLGFRMDHRPVIAQLRWEKSQDGS
jgi:hypothetical protein